MIRETELHQKTVMDSDGGYIGETDSVELNSHEGSIEQILVNPSTNAEAQRRSDNSYEKDSQNRYMIPSTEVEAVEDCVIVKRR